MSAYLYALPLNDDTLKIGCHLGDAEALDDRYGTYVRREHLKEKIMVPVEPEHRFIFEQALHRLIRRHDGVHLEKEKYTPDAISLFHAYVGPFRLHARAHAKQDAPSIAGFLNEGQQTTATITTDELYSRMREEKRLEKIAQHEYAKKRDAMIFIRGIVEEIVDTTMEDIKPRIKKDRFQNFLEDEAKVIYCMGHVTKLADIKRAYEGHIGTQLSNALDKATFQRVNPNWCVVQPMTCKICHQPFTMAPKCCANSTRASRTSGKQVVRNLRLL